MSQTKQEILDLLINKVKVYGLYKGEYLISLDEENLSVLVKLMKSSYNEGFKDGQNLPF